MRSHSTGGRAHDPDAAPRLGPAASDGFTLIEVLIATALTAGALVALAGLVATTARGGRAARAQTSATALAAARLEDLRALTWTDAVEDTTTDLSRDPAASAGTGLRPSPADSLDLDVPGFVDFLDASGRWVGSDPSRSAGASFVRRWRITPVTGLTDTLCLEVLVGALGSAARRDAAYLSTLLTRKAE